MNDRGRQYEAPNDRGRSPSRSGDGDRSSRERSRSGERGDRYTRGRQSESESTVQHLWTAEEEPQISDLQDNIRSFNEQKIKEVINNCNLGEICTEALKNLELSDDDDDDKVHPDYRSGISDILYLKDINDHDVFAAKLRSMLQPNSNWSSDQAAVEIIYAAIHKKWEERPRG